MTATPDSVPRIQLSDSVSIPQVGFGTFQIPPDATQEAVESALEMGYRHIDTAAAYYNEAGVGAAIRASGIPRDEIFVTTKLRNGDQGYETGLKAFDHSVEQLGLDHVDLYLLHWPVPTKDQYLETWKAIEKVQADGGTRAVGVCNFLPEHLERLLANCESRPVINQIELHPTLQQRAAAQASVDAGLTVEAYSPLGQGGDLKTEVVTRLAEAKGVTPGQIVLRWHLDAGRVVIPKSVTPERQRANIDLFGFELTDDERAEIETLEDGTRVCPDPATFEAPQDPK